MIGDDEGVILEEDSEEEEGYLFAGQGNLFVLHSIVCMLLLPLTHVVFYHFNRGH